MRSPKNRSLLGVNEDFEGKRNDKIHFLFSLLILSAKWAFSTINHQNGGLLF